MGNNPLWDLTLDTQASLQSDVPVKKVLLPLPGERKPEREPLVIQTSNGPRHIGRGRTFDEVRLRVRGQIVDQFRDRPQRKTCTGREINVPNLGKTIQNLLRRRLCGRNDTPCAPFAAKALRELNGRNILKGADDFGILLSVDIPVHMDDDGATACGPMACGLFDPVKGLVDQHDNSDAHAQLPFDMRPRISSCRQLMYFSDHLHQRSVPSSTASA